MDVLKRLAQSAVVPVVTLDKAEDAVPTAKAMLAGGVDVMEITFRTIAAADSIKEVSTECPDMLVGAGTIVNLEQCKLAVECGAKFVVAPGYDEESVAWCCENGIAITPGCATPTEIMMARKHGLNVIKFFPANIYGGMDAIKALSGPFPGVKFIPTGGVNMENCAEFISSPLIQAVGGSWVCPKADIAAGNFEKITALCKETRKNLLGFELAHISINCEDAESSAAVISDFETAFDFTPKYGNSSNFASGSVEVMKSMFNGANSYVAIRTNKIIPAIAEMEKRGYEFEWDAVKNKDNIKSIYFKKEMGGFVVHLLQK